ncbi:Nrap protein [Martensiomyces pterosporus]|nr:Nrap protein [Martensiomyces pterosporus]
MAPGLADKRKRKSSGAELSENPQRTKRQSKPAVVEQETDEDVIDYEDDDRFAASDDSGDESSGVDGEDGLDEPMLSGENASDETKLQPQQAGDHKHERGLNANPTNSEIMALNETSLLFKSNLFKLQVDELLSESAILANTKPTRALDAALKQIRDVLTSLDDQKEMSVDAAANFVRKLSRSVGGSKALQIPFPDPSPVVNMPMTLGFKAPEVVNVVGSYPLGMAVRTRNGFNVDVVVQMPEELFQDRDHLNFRYFYKRAFYVAMLLIGLQQSPLSDLFDMELGSLRGDMRLPVVVMRPKSDVKHLSKLNCTIRVVPSISRDTLPLKRLMPGRNHVRPSYIAAKKHTSAANSAADNADEGDLPATPVYNSTLLSDALLLTHMKYLFETTEMCPEFAHAAGLLRIWLSQRNVAGEKFGQGHLVGSQRLNGFVLTMILAWLVRGAQSGGGSGSKLSGSMSAYQLFKSTIEFLAAHDFEENPIQFGTDADIDEFANNFNAVFVDPSASLNLLAGVQGWELAELRMEARRTALDLNSSADDRFSHVFLNKALSEVAVKYDHVFRIEADLSKFLSPKHGADMDTTRRLADLEFGHPVAAVQSRISSFLSSALQRQARLVAVHPCADKSFSEGNKAMRRHVFVVGIIADAAESRRMVDLGPNPDAQPEEAARYRAYWGERAELRRFRDGAIRLATVWGASGMPFERRVLILPRMVAFLLRRHFCIRATPEIMTPEDLVIVDKARPKSSQAFGSVDDTTNGSTLFCLSTRIVPFAQTLDDCGGDVESQALAPADLGTFEAAVSGYDELQREIKELEEKLPLHVLALHPVSPGLRYASLVPPKPLPLDEGRGDDSFIEPLHVLVEFESSTKWPDDIAALHKVKAAFLMRIADCYRAEHPDAHVDVVNRFYGYGAADGLLTGGSSLTLGAQENFDYEGDNFIDIRHATSGFTFRLSILCDREGTLLEKKASEMRVAGLALRADALDMARRRWARNNQWRAMHHRHILDLCQRHHPAASMTIRLLKRWLSRHMLLGQAVGVPEEVAELVAAHVFSDVSDALSAPATGYAGFVRCLRLLAEWSWKDDLFAVDFSADSREGDGEGEDDDDDGLVAKTLAQGVWLSKGMSVDAFRAIQKAFDGAKEKNKCKGGWRVATEDDPEASWWGTGSPILTRRLRTLAKASLQCIADCLAAGSDESLPQVFATPLADYDFIIKLDGDAVCRKYEQPPKSAFRTLADTTADTTGAKQEGRDEEESGGQEIFKNLLPTMQLQSQQGKRSSVRRHPNPFNQPGMVGFDPVDLYVRDLVNVYHDSILFFNDMYGGNIIAGLWIPSVVQQDMPLNSKAHANVEPAAAQKKASRPMVKYNTDAVVEGIIRLGEGLVDDFILQKE